MGDLVALVNASKVEAIPQSHHFLGEVYPEHREGLEWPPRCVMLGYALGTKAIWFTYKAGRFFPLQYIYSIDPRCLCCEGKGALIDECLFDVRQLPQKYLNYLKIDCSDVEFNTEKLHIRTAIRRAVKDGHDFITHQKTVGWKK